MIHWISCSYDTISAFISVYFIETDEVFDLPKPKSSRQVRHGGKKAKQDKQKSIVTCTTCRKDFKRVNFYQHLLDVNYHDNDVVCHLCEKKFKSKIAVKYHLGTYHVVGDNTNRCKGCGKMYPTRTHIKTHLQKNPDHNIPHR